MVEGIGCDLKMLLVGQVGDHTLAMLLDTYRQLCRHGSVQRQRQPLEHPSDPIILCTSVRLVLLVRAVLLVGGAFAPSGKRWVWGAPKC